MRVATLLLVFAILSSFLAPFVFAAESKHDKDVRECRKAPPVMQHPGDLKKAKAEAFNACMAARAHPGSKPRAK